ncbi:helix-turn-helix domain-containing protein [Cellulomonas sp. NPDC089187]|uniref:GlxA family transcriptional regulator n=1 Tax=Cellulomonas sp. NPDC089187 TaxID=3154970 RepID=UPI00341FC607
MLQRVAAIAIPGVSPVDFGVVCEVFGLGDTAGPAVDLTLCTPEPGDVPFSTGPSVRIEPDLSATVDADLVIVLPSGDLIVPPDSALPSPIASSSIPSDLTPPGPIPSGLIPRVLVPPVLPGQTLPDPMSTSLRTAHERGARVLGIGTGAFALGRAGLLDGRRCTTHWRHTAELAAQFPAARVDPAALHLEDSAVLTSAGAAAGIDACLHLIRAEHGERAAATVARHLVVPPHRSGNQLQYVDAPTPHEADTLAELLGWMSEHLAQELSVPELAARASMSERTFARRFRAETGTTPAAWLTRQRLLRARELLERTDAGVEEVARASGFGTAGVLRHHFARVLDTTPQAYRRQFASTPEATADR